MNIDESRRRLRRRRAADWVQALYEAAAQRSRDAARLKEIELQNVLDAGPPAGSGISVEAWQTWNEYGWVICPRTKLTCSDARCGMGPGCQAMAAYGLRGDGSPLTHNQRPECGALNR